MRVERYGSYLRAASLCRNKLYRIADTRSDTHKSVANQRVQQCAKEC